jgi:HEPN domain-containing protein
MVPDYVTRLRAEIERRERSKRYCDAAEGQKWFSEMLRREDNDRCLNNACGRLEAALSLS